MRSIRINRKGGGVWELGGAGSLQGRLLTNINSSLCLFGPNFKQTVDAERILASANDVWVPVYILKEMASYSFELD